MATAYDTANIIIPQGGGYKSGSLYGWNPQDSSLVDFSVARAGATATRVNSSGLIESVSANLPRIDWAEGGSCPSLLVEPQRTNTLINSSDFSGYLTSGSITLTANFGVSPDGGTNSTRVQFSGASETLYIGAAHSANDEGNAIYIKGTASETITFGRGANVAQGSVKTLTGDWQRIEDFSSAGGLFIAASTYNGATARDIEIWGAEIQVLSGTDVSYMTSHIPTAGSTETRNADVISATGLSNIGGPSATIYIQSLCFDNTTNKYFSIRNATERQRLGFSAIGNFQGFGNPSGGNGNTVILSGGAYVSETYYKQALRIEENNVNYYVNGSSVATALDTGSFSPFTSFRFDDNTSFPFYGRLRVLAVYDYAFTDTELANLTT